MSQTHSPVGTGLSCALGLFAAVAAARACAAAGPQSSAGSGRIADCPPDRSFRVAVGYGRTFNFWYLLSGRVVPLTVTWRCDRYEFGIFRFGPQDQNIYGAPERVARADYAVSLSRRWYLHRWNDTGVFIGLGASYRTFAGVSEGNALNSSHLNFAEQAGVRWRGGRGGPGLELVVRHFSNAGIVRPNRGQNFVDLAVVF